jgi:uncharacterized protein YndB with AHSA1/START domain
VEPLFSHGPRSESSQPAHEVPPARAHRLSVPAPREIAYSAFVGDIHLWWPSNYTGFGSSTHVYVEDGIIGEESEVGDTQAWGRVTAEDPPSSVEFAWTLAWRADAPTRVRVDFQPNPSGTGDGTTVTFVHDGWAPGAEGREQYEKYSDWPAILGRYAAYFGVPAEAVETIE